MGTDLVVLQYHQVRPHGFSALPFPLTLLAILQKILYFIRDLWYNIYIFLGDALRKEGWGE